MLDLRLWTRLPALAERFWSPATLTDPADLYRRLDVFVDRVLPAAGISLMADTRSHWRRLGVDPAWDDFLEMVEPVKWYGRLLGAEALAARLSGTEMPQARPYDPASPLDSLIDHLPVESRRARQVAGLCARVIRDDGDARAELEALIRRWRALAAGAADAPAGLAPLVGKLIRLGELIEDRLSGGSAVPETVLAELQNPEGEFILALPPPLRQWLTAP